MSEEKSAYGKGFAIRMVVLLLLLAAVGFGFYKDNEMTKNANARITEMMNTLTRQADDGKGFLTKEDVKKEFGFEPADRKTVGEYEVERFEFKRVLPFSKGQFINVAYSDGRVYEAVVNKEFDPDANSGPSSLMAGVKMMPESERTMPAAAVAGGGGGGNGNGGGGRPDPSQIVDRIMGQDKDEDGKVSKDEASDRLKDRFDDMDEDKDGFLTKEEVEKSINARVNRDEETVEIGDGRPAGDSDDAKEAEETKSDETKSDETKSDETKKDDGKTEEAKSGESEDDKSKEAEGDKSDG